MQTPTSLPFFSNATPHSAKHQSHVPCRTRRLRYLPTQGRWDEPETAGLRAGIKLTAIGLATLAGFGLIALLGAADYAPLLFLFGSVFFAIGAILLLVTLGRSIGGRIRRIQRHCGRCRFYQAQGGIYAFGRCGAAPGEPSVRRMDSCPWFCYSERAMVHERLSQRPDLLKQIRITRAG